jgi:hypothetical protein
MGVETWLYDWIGRPHLHARGEAPAGLSSDCQVDWIDAGDITPLCAQAHFPQIVVRGGHGFDWIADQCRLNSGDVSLETSREEWHVSLNHDTTTNLTLTLRDHSSKTLEELHRIGFRQSDLLSRFWTMAPGGIGIFGGWGDLQARRRRSKFHDLDLSFHINLLPEDIGKTTEQEILDFGEAKGLIPETLQHVRQFVGYVAQVYQMLPEGIEQDRLRANLHNIFAAFPSSARLVMLLPPTRGARGEPRQLYGRPGVDEYRAVVRDVAALYDYVELVDVDDFVTGVDDFEPAADRLSRNVYLQIYQAVIARCR